jgi:hypothetical protein
VNTLQFPGNPASFILRRGQLDNTNLLAFRFVGAKNFLGEVRADGVLPDDLRGDA